MGKKICFIFTVLSVLFIFTGCLTTSNTSVNTFSTSDKTKVGKMIVSSDEFADTKTAVHEDIGVDYSSGVVDLLYFEPYFVYSNESVSFFIKIQYDSLGYSTTVCEKIILLGNSGKVTINIKGSTEIQSEKTTSSILGNDNKSIVSERISKEDYEKLTDFFAKNETVRMGFYTTGNKAMEFKEYSTRAHTIFADAYEFYINNLSSKINSDIETNMLIWN